MRPSLATDRISLGFWLNISFVVNHRRAFRSIIAFAIDLLTSEDRYFLGIALAPCYTRAERATQSAARVGSSLFDFLTVSSTHYVPKIVFAFSPICRACKNSTEIYLITMRDLIFSLRRTATAIRHWVFWLVVIVTTGSGTSLVIVQWLEHSTYTRKYVA